MKKTALILLACIALSFLPKTDFLAEQKKFERVKSAYTEKESVIEAPLKVHTISKDNLNILIVVYKEEQELDVYAKNKNESAYTKINSYKICASSGVLGPKRKQGDGQVPEGFYSIEKFNPASNYYLSLGVSYPNRADKLKSRAPNLGSDIFIHGECVTIGCIPMTNDKIKEIYIYAAQARQSGQANIPVYIFPYKMTAENSKMHSYKYKAQPELLKFWENIKEGYDKLMKNNKEVNYSVDGKGDYVFN